MADTLRENLYWFGPCGFVYTTPWLDSPSTERQSAVLLVSANGRPFELATRSGRLAGTAFAVGPMVRRSLRALDAGLVSVNVQPDHPAFGAFCRLGGAGIRPLDRSTFSIFDGALAGAYEGRLSHRRAERLFSEIVDHAASQLGRSHADHPGPTPLQAFLRKQAEGSLDEIASALDVTYTTASRLFVREMGVPFRAYRHYVMAMRAAEQFRGDLQLTEIAQRAGFADSAHLSRSWQRRFGFAPSHFRDRGRVRIFD